MALLFIILLIINFFGFYDAYIFRKQTETTFLTRILDTSFMRIVWYTLGIVGTLIGFAMYDSHLNRVSKEWEVKQKKTQEKRCIETYGALPEEINRKIPGSENLKRLESLILSLPYLPYELNIDASKIYWFIVDENSEHRTEKIYYEDNGIAIVPRECVRTLTRSLASRESIKTRYEYCEDCSDWGDRYFLSLRQEYRSPTNSW